MPASSKPLISIIIPTLNSETVLTNCLDSIKNQKYNNYEIIISDGGSTDDTINISKKHKCKIIINKLKTAEAGKALGLKNARGKYIAFIDSDNILPTSSWISEMIYPLQKDKYIFGSEPWDFTYRPHAGFIERYCSLIGANDPYAYITGISDRRNTINNQWSSIKLSQINYQKYIKIKLQPNQSIPTIGANGTIFRTKFLQSNFKLNYLFDIDVISKILNDTQKTLYFAKTKNGIIHTYCEASVTKFYKKQIRRLRDYYSFKDFRSYNYNNNFSQNKRNTLQILIKNNLNFVIYTILVLPMLITSFKGFVKKPDIAWFFHPLACIITLYSYIYITILYLLGFSVTQTRKNWTQ